MRTFLIVLFVCIYSISFGQNVKASKQTGWLFYWGGAVVWFSSDKNTNRVKEHHFFDKSQYTNGLKVSYIPDALFYKSIAKGYKISEVALNGSLTINKEPIADDSIWIIPVKALSKANTTPLSGLSPIDTLIFKEGSNKLSVSFSFETDYEISHLGLLSKKDKRRLKQVKNYVVFPPH